MADAAKQAVIKRVVSFCFAGAIEAHLELQIAGEFRRLRRLGVLPALQDCTFVSHMMLFRYPSSNLSRP